MPNILDVRAAINSGDKEQARRLLNQLLRENPNDTEAWFLAAQVSDGKETKIKHLRKVLILDPTHVRARAALNKLGGKEPDPFEALVEVQRGVESAGGVRGLWQQIPPIGRIGLLAAIIFLPICLVVNALGNTVANLPVEEFTPTPRPTPTERPFVLWTPQQMADYFAASGLGVTVSEIDSEPSEINAYIKGRVVLDFVDASGLDRQVRLIFYNSQDDIFADEPRLIEQGWLSAAYNRNAVLLYKEGLDGQLLRRFVDWFDAAVDPQQMQGAIAAAYATQTATAAPTVQATAEVTPSAP